MIRFTVDKLTFKEKVQIIEEHLAFEKSGVLPEDNLLRTLTKQIGYEPGYFILQAYNVAHEVALNLAKEHIKDYLKD